jgi:5'-methylthioadenosine phosphorylase
METRPSPGTRRIGVIGGSGIYQVEGLSGARWERIASPFGEPSDEVLTGDLAGVSVCFLPRHGRGHRIPPGEINFRANIDALKRAGVTDVIAVSAVGSLREELPPGTIVIVDQFVDRTFARVKSFFGAGCVAHVSMADPVCARIGDALEIAARRAGVNHARGGTCVVMEGPQFSTRAESELYRSWGASVIGMTTMPEAKLAREAELCYATMALVTDYDCWRSGHEAVTVEEVVRTMRANADAARTVLKGAIPALAGREVPCPRGCDRALENAIMTAPDAREDAVTARLDAIAGRVL